MAQHLTPLELCVVFVWAVLELLIGAWMLERFGELIGFTFIGLATIGLFVLILSGFFEE